MKKFTSLTAILLCMACMAYGQWTYTSLSDARYHMGSATIGNKAYFAGGFTGTQLFSSVEVYDMATGIWSNAGNLFEPREFVGGAVSCGSKVFFGGGYDEGSTYNIVDIYDTQTQEWSVELLSVDRFSLAAVSHGDTVMFAGGIQIQGAPSFKNTVDFYNAGTGEWSAPAALSQARGGIAAAVVGDLALFAGGWINLSGTTSNRVDIYNFTTKTWSQASLSLARAYASAVAVGNKVIIAGGVITLNSPTDRVDIYDAETSVWTTATLSEPRSAIDNGAAVGGKAYFAGGGVFHGSGFSAPSGIVDVYDPETNIWSVMNLQEPRCSHAVLGVGNYLVVAGGKNNSGPLSSIEIFNAVPTSCLPEGITFTTQEEIDNFQVNYPGCTEIEGDVIITGYEITNLSGLTVLTTIGGSLNIVQTYGLINLSGLENFTFLGGSLSIVANISLTRLNGLDNLGAGSIESLNIIFNPLLATCDVQSICDYLMAPNSIIEIHDNAPGCNSPTEVEEACLLSVGETGVENQITLFPNPADNTISIGVNGGLEIEEVSISNHLGLVVLQKKPVNNFLDVSALQPGIYLIEIISDQAKTIQKLIIQ